MRKAYQNVKSSGRVTEYVDIVTTHLYVRFKPGNEAQLDLLRKDTAIDLYEYPLDYELLGGRDFYRDIEVPAGQPAYQYVALPVSYKFPPIEYELLANLYIPEEGEDVKSARKSSADMTGIIVEEALRITNNLVEPALTGGRVKRDDWRPAGRIRVWDDRTNSWSLVEGVEVRARRWFTTHNGITDANGNYFCNGTFKREANYSIEWDRWDYSIRSNAVGQAILNGPKQTGNWNADLPDDDLQQFYAFIHIGAHQYYYGNRLGLKTPPQNALLKPQMKIGAYDENGRANHNDDRRLLGIRNQVRMYRLNNGRAQNSEEIYSTTFHELAHASHWELRKGEWDNKTSDRLQESWAMGVARELTRVRYLNHNWWADVTFEWMRTTGENIYTPLVIDLIDTDNQGLFDNTRPFDRVGGYTIAQIEAVLGSCGNIEGLRNNLRDTYDNPSEVFLNELFTQYINLAR